MLRSDPLPDKLQLQPQDLVEGMALHIDAELLSDLFLQSGLRDQTAL